MEQAAILAMAKQLSEEELRDIFTPKELKRHSGRPKLSNKLEMTSIPLSRETIELMKKLASERGMRLGELGRQLILLGLPALTGQSVYELLEDVEDAKRASKR